jgi:acid phosphatase (class A)
MKPPLHLIPIAAFFIATTAIPLFAQGDRKPIFISPDELQVDLILAGPPSADSKQTASDLAELHRLQDARTPAQIERAQADDAEEDIFIFKNVLGDKFTRDSLPLTALLSGHILGDEGSIVNPAKDLFRRQRPYRADATLKPVCKVNASMTDYSYPSGRALSGYLEAFAAALLVPEKRDAILARADDYAHNRLICGVHYPSDVTASKQTAYAMIGIMMNKPQFKKELAAAKAETRKALGL